MFWKHWYIYIESISCNHCFLYADVKLKNACTWGLFEKEDLNVLYIYYLDKQHSCRGDWHVNQEMFGVLFENHSV